MLTCSSAASMASRRCRLSPTRRLNFPEYLRSDNGWGTVSPCFCMSATVSAIRSSRPVRASTWDEAKQDRDAPLLGPVHNQYTKRPLTALNHRCPQRRSLEQYQRFTRLSTTTSDPDKD